jgi:hypothetical protein
MNDIVLLGIALVLVLVGGPLLPASEEEQSPPGAEEKSS